MRWSRTRWSRRDPRSARSGGRSRDSARRGRARSLPRRTATPRRSSERRTTAASSHRRGIPGRRCRMHRLRSRLPAGSIAVVDLRFLQAIGECSLRTGDWAVALDELQDALLDDWAAPDRMSILGPMGAIATLRGPTNLPASLARSRGCWSRPLRVAPRDRPVRGRERGVRERPSRRGRRSGEGRREVLGKRAGLDLGPGTQRPVARGCERGLGTCWASWMRPACMALRSRPTGSLSVPVSPRSRAGSATHARALPRGVTVLAGPRPRMGRGAVRHRHGHAARPRRPGGAGGRRRRSRDPRPTRGRTVRRAPRRRDGGLTRPALGGPHARLRASREPEDPPAVADGPPSIAWWWRWGEGRTPPSRTLRLEPATSVSDDFRQPVGRPSAGFRPAHLRVPRSGLAPAYAASAGLHLR